MSAVKAYDLCPRCGHAWGMHCVPVRPRVVADVTANGIEIEAVVSSPCAQRGPDGRAPKVCNCTARPPYATDCDG